MVNVTSLLEVLSPSTLHVNTPSGNTSFVPFNSKAIRISTEVVLFSTMFAINLAMGCTMTLNDFKRQWKYPGGIILGVISQFALFPLVVFGLNYLLKMPDPYAVGVILTIVSPGGSVSNLMTYFVDGDICMSVCTTFISTVLSIGLTPWLFYVYTRGWSSDVPGVPYFIICAMLFLVLIPLCIGMALRSWKQKISLIIVTIGTTTGLVVYSLGAFVNIFIQSVFHGSWNLYFMALILPIVGFGLGYGTGCLFQQHPSRCRTLAIETISQNTAITIIIIVLTMSDFDWTECVVFPILYTAVAVLYGLAYTLMYSSYQKHYSKGQPTAMRVVSDGYASLEPSEDFENPWQVGDEVLDMSFKY